MRKLVTWPGKGKTKINTAVANEIITPEALKKKSTKLSMFKTPRKS